eukprot:Plantae.Rhodophyta-Rhodochaete_pulchella.ctg2334.p1 GENE.Plantae.Rhodophyta-Rhodochaete_pulchella.ctg2334~~Plantae.Rhodophyta-Rhodochaete_pulchella.ctg2334.p1  ORF type:complete len:340 (+),score=59.22 Plantae.Rhodophyta-Rhodochaete_pulchella.ctg2334:695-1714(+)
MAAQPRSSRLAAFTCCTPAARTLKPAVRNPQVEESSFVSTRPSLKWTTGDAVLAEERVQVKRRGIPIEMKRRKRIIKVKYEWEVAQPKLIIFDLEGTLWEPEISEIEGASGGGAPYKLDKRSGDVFDRNGLRIGLIGDTRDALLDLFEEDRWANVQTAAISNSDTSFGTSKVFLKKFRVAVDDNIRLYQVFDHIILKKGSVKNHLEMLHERTGVEYNDMLYFDNQRYNVAEAQIMGLCALFVKHGFAEGTFIRSLDSFQQFKRQLWRLEKPEDLFKNRKTGFKWARWSGAGKWFIPSKSIMPRNRKEEDWKKTSETATFGTLDEKIHGSTIGLDQEEED